MHPSGNKPLQNVQYGHQKADDINKTQREKKNVHFECAPLNTQPAVIQNNVVRKRNPRVPKKQCSEKVENQTIFSSFHFILRTGGQTLVKMVLMTMIGRVIDGLPLAASMQSDQDVSVNVDVQVHIQLIPANNVCLCLILLAKRDKDDVTDDQLLNLF